MAELKDTVARGVTWSLAEKIGTMLLQLAVSLVLLRLLTREMYGVVAILTAIVSVALIIADSGFSQSLIRKTAPSTADYKSVFVFNLGISLLLYVLFTAVSAPVARFYNMPDLVRIAPVFFLQIPFGALTSVQNAVYMRQFRFALLSKVNLASWFVSGLVAIVFALKGLGIWSIVVQRVLQLAVRSLLLWWLSDWRPIGRFSRASLREMAPFSCNLLATDLLSTVYSKIPQFFLGRLYPADVLGAYDQAVKLKDMPTLSAVQAVQGVTFPAMAKIKDDAPKFAESYRQIMAVTAYVMFPIMLGLSAVAYDLFAVVVGTEWLPAVPYFETVCLAGLFYPLSMLAYNVLKVKTEGAAIFKLELWKKVMMTLVFAATIPFSVQAVVWGLVGIAFCEMVINFAATTRLTSLSTRRFVRSLLPSALLSIVMYILVRLSALAVADRAALRLVIEVTVGVVSYAALSALFRLEAFREVMTMVRKQFLHR